MKTFFTFLISVLCLVNLRAQERPVPPTTPYTRNFLISTDAASASAALGLSDGTNAFTFYVRVNGVNNSGVPGSLGHPYKDIDYAVGVANTLRANGNTNRMVVDVGVGVFDQTIDSIYPTDNFHIRGAGKYITEILYAGNEHTYGPAIMSSTNLTVSDLTIRCPTNVADDYTCFGTLSDSPNNNDSVTNYIYNCRLIAGAHGIQTNPTNPGPTKIIAYFCDFMSPNAAVQTLKSNATIELHNCYVEDIGPEPNGRFFTCGAQNFGGTMWLDNTYLKVRGAGNAAECYGLTTTLSGSVIVSGITNILTNCRFDIATAAGTVADVSISTNLATNIVFGCARSDGTALRYLLSNGGVITPEVENYVSILTNAAAATRSGILYPSNLTASVVLGAAADGSITNSALTVYTGRTNITSVATSLIVAIGHTMPNTNYVPTVVVSGAALVAANSQTYSSLTTTSFTVNFTAALGVSDTNLIWSVVSGQ